jgi:hypothetical protein
MAEERGEEPPANLGAPPASPETTPAGEAPLPAPPVARPAGITRQAVVWLAVLLAVVIIWVALSPFWAPALAPLLPWGRRPAAAGGDVTALAARVTALEQRPVAPTVDVDAIKSAQSMLAQRVDRLEAAVQGLGRNQGNETATKAALAQLGQRLDATDAQSASSAASQASDIRKLQQEQSRIDGAAADLGRRLTELQQQVHAQGVADRSGAALLLALMQMRQAVEEARPFPDEYGAFKALARDDPKLVAAAEPLARPARDGVASRVVLRQRLADLATQTPAAKQPDAKLTWWAQALARIRGLVTIRRIDGAAKTGPEAAIDSAQSALARGDLAAAVSALDSLTGANAAAARPWLEMARERLAAETALRQLQELLAAQVGAPQPVAPAAAPMPSPSAAPPQPPAAPRAPS